MNTYNNFLHGQEAITVGGTPQQLTGLGGSAQGVVIKAMGANVGSIFIGKDNAVSATNGFELRPGEALPMELLNPRKLWMVGPTTGDRICWGVVKS